MTPQELERAITGPVEQLGITFEPALVAELIREVVARAGALPLLQYTLTELFDRRIGDRIRHTTYVELGGVSGALAQRAEGLMAGLGHDAHDVTRQVFLRLVTFSDDSDDTRRRVLRSELEQLGLPRGVLHNVLETFGRHRLLSFDRDPVTRSPTVEISHEALLTAWPRLSDWIDEARHDVRIHQRLTTALREWTAADRSETFLLRGGLLEQVHGWAGTTSFRLSNLEQEFIEASVTERDREVEQARQRELRAATAERRERQRLRQLAAVGVVAVLVTALAVFGTVQWRSAANAKDDVDDLLTVSDLVSASETALDRRPGALSVARSAVGARDRRPRIRDRGSDRRRALRTPRAGRSIRRRQRHPGCRQVGSPRARRGVRTAAERVGGPRRIGGFAPAHRCRMCDVSVGLVPWGSQHSRRPALAGRPRRVRSGRSRPASARGNEHHHGGQHLARGRRLRPRVGGVHRAHRDRGRTDRQ